MTDSHEIVYASTILLRSDLTELKRKTGETSIKDAIAAAVKFYLDQND